MIDEDIYQDIRIQGKTVIKGRRECETRYRVLKNLLDRYDKYDSFSLLDFGANYGYFSWRIKEDYPNAEITLIDSRPLLKLLYESNKENGINLINKTMDLEAIEKFKEDHHYDIILLMSILHHFPEPESVLDTFKEMGEILITEIDYPTVPNFMNNQKEIYNLVQKENPIQINSWIDHDRPIYYINDNDGSIKGKVMSGSGLATKSFKILNNVFQWFNFPMYPGTLNVSLEKGLIFSPRFKVDSYIFTKIYLNGFPVFIIKDTNLNTSNKFLEIVSPFKLREKFDFEDGDDVIISFKKEDTQVIE